MRVSIATARGGTTHHPASRRERGSHDPSFATLDAVRGTQSQARDPWVALLGVAHSPPVILSPEPALRPLVYPLVFTSARPQGKNTGTCDPVFYAGSRGPGKRRTANAEAPHDRVQVGGRRCRCAPAPGSLAVRPRSRGAPCGRPARTLAGGRRGCGVRADPAQLIGTFALVRHRFGGQGVGKLGGRAGLAGGRSPAGRSVVGSGRVSGAAAPRRRSCVRRGEQVTAPVGLATSAAPHWRGRVAQVGRVGGPPAPGGRRPGRPGAPIAPSSGSRRAQANAGSARPAVARPS